MKFSKNQNQWNIKHKYQEGVYQRNIIISTAGRITSDGNVRTQGEYKRNTGNDEGTGKRKAVRLDEGIKTYITQVYTTTIRSNTEHNWVLLRKK